MTLKSEANYQGGELIAQLQLRKAKQNREHNFGNTLNAGKLCDGNTKIKCVTYAVMKGWDGGGRVERYMQTVLTLWKSIFFIHCVASDFIDLPLRYFPFSYSIDVISIISYHRKAFVPIFWYIHISCRTQVLRVFRFACDQASSF